MNDGEPIRQPMQDEETVSQHVPPNDEEACLAPAEQAYLPGETTTAASENDDNNNLTQQGQRFISSANEDGAQNEEDQLNTQVQTSTDVSEPFVADSDRTNDEENRTEYQETPSTNELDNHLLALEASPEHPAPPSCNEGTEDSSSTVNGSQNQQADVLADDDDEDDGEEEEVLSALREVACTVSSSETACNFENSLHEQADETASETENSSNAVSSEFRAQQDRPRNDAANVRREGPIPLIEAEVVSSETVELESRHRQLETEVEERQRTLGRPVGIQMATLARPHRRRQRWKLFGWRAEENGCSGLKCILVSVLAVVSLSGIVAGVSVVLARQRDDTFYSKPTAGTSPENSFPSSAPSVAMERYKECQNLPIEQVDLVRAVDKYLTLDVASRPNSSVAQEYGWPIGTWNVSRVTDFDRLFSTVRNPMMADFNEDISLWDVSSATTMEEMFFGAAAFNGDLSLWNVSSVEKTRSMFEAAHAFQGDGLDSWNVSRVTDMSSMFGNAFSFNANLSMWDTSRVLRMHFVFAGASAFDQDLSGWNVSKVEVMNGLFNDCRLFNSDLSSWDVSRVQAMSLMFEGARSFNQDLSSWQVGNVQFMLKMFANATSFAQNLCPWGLKLPQQSEIISGMFWNTSCEEQDGPSWSSSPPGPFCFACDPV